MKPKKPQLTPEKRSAAEQAWLKENRVAIAAYNERVEKHGMLLKPIWLR
jgi:post-segregation antitoxin (ccd killing protein)